MLYYYTISCGKVKHVNTKYGIEKTYGLLLTKNRKPAIFRHNPTFIKKAGIEKYNTLISFYIFYREKGVFCIKKRAFFARFLFYENFILDCGLYSFFKFFNAVRG